MFGLQAAVPGYGLRDLSKANLTINEAIKKQSLRQPGENRACIRRGPPFPRPTLYTAGVGQASEMIKPQRTERAYRFIFRSIQIITEKTDPTNSCQHSAKVKARFGGWTRDRWSDRIAIYLSKIAHCMRSLAKLRWFEPFEWRRLAGALGTSGTREDWFAVVRYVDDVFIATR